MKVVVAVDSFKGSLTSLEAGEAVRNGVLLADPSAEVIIVPLADGGEGTLTAFDSRPDARPVEVDTADALGRPIRSSYLLLDDGHTAVIEAAATVGITQVVVDDTTPMYSSSAGVGQQLRHALESGATRIIIGLGGTACTDGGLGLLSALGMGTVHPLGANPLWDYNPGLLLHGLRRPSAEIVVLTDVSSPTLGPTGAVQMFGPQKGATPAQVAHLENQMIRWMSELGGASGIADLAERAGTGAAGGLGAALLALGGRLEPGFDFVAREVGLTEALRGADLVLTGEGRVDSQTVLGKGPAGVARAARAHGTRVVALCGSIDVTSWLSLHAVFDAVLSIQSGPRALDAALRPEIAAAELARTAAEVVCLLQGPPAHPQRHAT